MDCVYCYHMLYIVPLDTNVLLVWNAAILLAACPAPNSCVLQHVTHGAVAGGQLVPDNLAADPTTTCYNIASTAPGQPFGNKDVP
jgi:hypothetical protein